MPRFAIQEAANFRDGFSGFLAPDNGDYGLAFNDTVSNFYGTGKSVIGLFISEYTTRRHIPIIEGCVTDSADLELVLAGIITFGVHRDSDSTKVGKTHLDAVCRELKLPLLRLVKPADFPDYDAFDEEHFIGTWINNNPCVHLYYTQVGVSVLENTATIEQISS